MGYQIWFRSFFLKKAQTGWMRAENPVLEAHFPHISGSIGPIVSKNNRVLRCADPHQPREFNENRFKTATWVRAEIIIINWKCKSVIFKCKLKNTHKVSLLESILIQKKILWRINFVFIKFLLTLRAPWCFGPKVFKILGGTNGWFLY